MTYRFVQGIDYGPRQGTLGLAFHMSEGGDGLVGFLARRPGEGDSLWSARVNGVSCHAALLSTGEIVQMLDWIHASGNLNPADRAGEYGFYGGSVLRAVLGDHWTDPNTWTLSMEIAGYRATGPTPAQVEAAIRWGLEMRAAFPSLRGAIGHHDQSPKGCPGTTEAMKAIFAGVGGHGLWEINDMRDFTLLYGADGRLIAGTLTVKTDAPHEWLDLGDGTLKPASTTWIKHAVAVRLKADITPTPHPGVDRRTGFLIGDDAAFLLASDVEFTPYPPRETAAAFNAGLVAAQSAISAIPRRTA